MPPRRKKQPTRRPPTASDSGESSLVAAGPPAVPSIGSAIDPSLLQDLPTTTTELITADGTPEDFTIDTQARDWVNARVTDEIARLASLGASATPLTVSNFGIIIEDNDDADSAQASSNTSVAVNRIELKSTYDFTRIAQLLVSDPIDYPHRSAFKFVHLVLIPRSMRTQGPMLVPYLFDSQLKSEQGVSVPNNLDQWLLINQVGGRARHVIEQFVDVTATGEKGEEGSGQGTGKE